MSEESIRKRTILFNVTKRESYHPNNGLKKLIRKLRGNYNVSSNKDDIKLDVLKESDVFVFGGPRSIFSQSELEDVRLHLSSGGRVLVLSSEDSQQETNMNDLLQEFGITINNDSVVRSSFYKYLHPKEVFIAEGVLVPDLALKKNEVISGASRKLNASVKVSGQKTKTSDKLSFVYPYGSSLNIQRPSKPFLSSGPISFPVNRPLAGFWESETVAVNTGKRGRLVVIGSAEIFSDDWLDKEENGKLCDLLFAWLLNEIDLDMTSDRQDSDLSEHTSVPNMDGLSQVIKPCLQAIDELPRDFVNLFDGTMLKFDVDMIPQVLKTYEILAVPHNPLTLIPPQFECPLPKMAPATFPPSMREPPLPSLDQFDLEDHFARQDIRLAQLTNKCAQGEEDLEYYIAEAGEVLGIIQNLPFGERSAKHILFHILSSIVDFKMTDDHKSITTSHVDGYEYNDSGVLGFGKLASQNEDGPALEATNMPIHIPKVDLVPIQSQRSLQMN